MARRSGRGCRVASGGRLEIGDQALVVPQTSRPDATKSSSIFAQMPRIFAPPPVPNKIEKGPPGTLSEEGLSEPWSRPERVQGCFHA
jgi:hypothetical protein